MGCFSWLDCKSEKPVINGLNKKVYVLVPKEFHNKLGVRISENCYDGYGHFDGLDIYALVAFWNREHLSEDMLEEAPKLEDFCGLWSFEKESLKKSGKSDAEIDALDQAERKRQYESAMMRRKESVAMLHRYKNGEADALLEKDYGPEWLREIGIAIACYDEQNEKLPYPIKITYDGTARYEDCRPSKSDEGQGAW